MYKPLFKKISLVLASIGLIGSGMAAIQVLGAAPQFTAAKPTFLYGGGISSSATSIKLTSLVTPAGTAITTAQLVGGVGSVFYVTIEPATTKKETVSCTGVTQNADATALLTGCTRGLQFTYPYTALASLALSHAGGSSVVLSNSPQLYQDIISYINSSFAGGVNNASTIAKGILQLSTKLQQASSTAIGGGSTDAALGLYSANATSTYNAGAASGNGLNVVVTQNNNKIDEGFLPTTYSLNHTFAATTTINNAPSIMDTGGNSILWSFLASTTINAPATSFTLSNIPPRQFIKVYFINALNNIVSTNANVSFTFNGDAGINYSYAFSTTTLSVSLGAAGQNGIRVATTNTAQNIEMTIFNQSSLTKTIMFNGISGNTNSSIGSSTSPIMISGVGVWATSTNQQITSITASTSQPTVSFPLGSSMYVFGSQF